MSRFGIESLLRISSCGLGAALLLAASPAIACKCLPKPSPNEAMAEATAVFSGVVKSLATEGGETFVILQVSGTWKGAASQSIEVRTASSDEECGADFAVGESYLVYAYPKSRAPAEIVTTRCTRTRPMAEAAPDLNALGPAVAP
jgi:hypothetical protein